MAVFRIEKTRDFTVMSNYHLRDVELSLKAKGLLSLMLSLPEDWDYTTKGLACICKDGVDSITSALKELENHGYLTRQRTRYENGRLGDITYTIPEKPDSQEEKEETPKPEKPKWENPRQVNLKQEASAPTGKCFARKPRTPPPAGKTPPLSRRPAQAPPPSTLPR